MLKNYLSKQVCATVLTALMLLNLFTINVAALENPTDQITFDASNAPTDLVEANEELSDPVFSESQQQETEHTPSDEITEDLSVAADAELSSAEAPTEENKSPENSNETISFEENIPPVESPTEQNPIYDTAIIPNEIDNVMSEVINFDINNSLNLTAQATSSSNWQNIPAKVYVLSPEKAVPADGANLGIGNYYPAASTRNGVIYETNLEAKLSNEILEDLARSNGDKKLTTDDMLLVNSNDGITLPTDWKDLWNRFNLEEENCEITAYVLKVQYPNDYEGSSGNNWYGYDDNYNKADIHVDCYVSNVPVNVTYHSNFSKDTTRSSSIYTGEHHNVLSYENTELPTRDGYIFKGWATKANGTVAYSPDDSFLVVGNTDLYAIWAKGTAPAPVNYNVTYEYIGNIPSNAPPVPEKAKFVSGSTVEIAETPTLPGSTFSGWSSTDVTIVNNSFSMPKKDVVITGSFAVKTHNLVYMVDGVEYEREKLAYGSAIIPHAEPTKTGHTFSGWSVIPDTMPDEDVTIIGEFSINTYKVFYKVDNEDYASTDVTYDSNINLIEEPTKTGYTFSGWSSAPSKMPARDITIKGSFTVNKHDIIYMVDNAEHYRETLDCGAVITPIAEPTKTGHIFSGWSVIPATMPDEDVVIEGSFSKCSYKITYLVDGIEYKNTAYSYDAPIIPEADPTKIGYTFSGWDFIPERMPAENVTVTGSFTVNKHDVIYMVDGVEHARTELTFGSVITLIEAPTKTGYTFSGWSNIPETMPDEDVTITGTFSINTYKVIYKVDNEDYASVDVIYDTTINLIEEPSKIGYTFSGWSMAPANMPARDITITGTFTINSHDIIYMVDNSEHHRETLNYSASITPIAEPSKTGYTFSGWSEIPEFMPDNDIVITGSFTVNTHNIIYLVDSEEYHKEELAYGSVITPIAEPSKTGHAFSGWSETPETMPDEDVIIEGVFTKCSYKITYLVDDAMYKEDTYDYDTEIVSTAEPTKTGYTFSGWDFIPERMPAEDITVKGSFTVNKHDIIYMVDNAEHKRETLDYGATIIPISNPLKSGYRFSGWSTIPQTMPDEDVIITGSFIFNTYFINIDSSKAPTKPEAEEPEYYILTFETNGGTELDKEEHEAGAIVNLNKRPAKVGYVFEGWYLDEKLSRYTTEAVMEQDVTVYASWVKDNGIVGHGHPTPSKLNGDDHAAYVVGFPDGTVRPNDNMTRAEVSTIFFRLLKEDVRTENLASTNNFTDVSDSDWYNCAISTLEELGILTGDEQNNFSPNENITRAEFATICARFDDSEYEVSNGFTDINGHWATEYILEAAAHGWIKGYGDGSFRPNDHITRAEVMTLINRVLNRIPESNEDLHEEMIIWPDNNTDDWYYIPVQEATNSHDTQSKNHIYIKWTEINAVRDWTEYEK